MSNATFIRKGTPVAGETAALVRELGREDMRKAILRELEKMEKDSLGVQKSTIGAVRRMVEGIRLE